MALIKPENTIFAVLSFEGPDVYSQAGGLGVRATELSRSLAEGGYETHLFFIGDPGKEAVETHYDGLLTFHRWCQWISGYHPNGVYDGEGRKIFDYQDSVPHYLVNQVIRPAAQEGKFVVILAEEWHTTSTVINLHNYLRGIGLRNNVVIFWNANNTYGFWNIDWWRLQEACTVTTVSRYMKHVMWDRNVNPMVIPNGIPRRLLAPVSSGGVHQLQELYSDRFFLAKVGRYTPDKRWIMAIDSVAYLKRTGHKVIMLMRGGMEPHRGDVYMRAHQLGLDIREIRVQNPDFSRIMKTLEENMDADLL
jgi:glycosyltransferase involved in cell wall biosynthesis